MTSYILLCTFLSLVVMIESRSHVNIRRPWYCGEKEPPRFDNETATYMILAPKKVRSGLPYAVSINILEEQTEPVDVEIKITDHSKNTKLETKLEGLTSGKPTMASLGLVPADLTSSSNKLVVKATLKASGEVVFENSHNLELSTDSLSIFIQTDKALYKPGDLVQFRAIVTKPDLTPFKGFVNVQIKNADNTVIKQFKALPLDKGVASAELQLSEDLTLGDWSIFVGVEDESNAILPDKKSKKFEVAKYVLPKFDIRLTIPSFTTHGEDIPITISSKYTYGKGVRGTGFLVASGRDAFGGIEDKFTLSDKGTADIVIKYADIKGRGLVREGSTSSLDFYATVTEALTDIEISGTGKITVHTNKEKLIVVNQGGFFKPGMDYPLLIYVVTQDNNPIAADADKTVHYYAEFYTRDGNKEDNQTIQLDEDGTKEIILKTHENATSFSLTAYYKERPGDNKSPVSGYICVNAFRSRSGSFIQLTNDNDGVLKVGDDAAFTIEKSGDFAINSLTLQVINKGSVVFAKQGDPSGDKLTINVKITHNMTPKSQVLVYAIRSDNDEVLADAVRFQVDGLFRNKVTVTIDPEEAKPYNDDGVKNEVTVTVDADPESFVGLLGVDQSVLLLKTGNDVTQSEVETEMEKYDGTTKSSGFGRRPLPFRRGLIFDFGGENAGNLMRNSGMLIFTDAYLYKKCIYKPGWFKIWFEGDQRRIKKKKKKRKGKKRKRKGKKKKRRKIKRCKRPMKRRKLKRRKKKRKTKSTQKYQKAKKQNVKVRTLFPESWLFSSAFAGADGKVQHRAKVPDTISSFIVSAFATNDKTGLGIAAVPAKLKVFRPFFVFLNLPYSIKQGEKFALQTLVFNYFDANQTVTVTLDHNEDSGFDFVKKSTDKGTKDKKYNERKVQVKGGGGAATVKFAIVPTVIGHVKLLVKAIGQTATDAVERRLLVEPEGMRVYFNRPMVLDFTESDTGSFESAIDMTPPADIEKDFVKDSERAEFSVLGDMMGPLLSGLENLVRMPTGCGEQNMVTMVPNIIVMKYLDATGEVENYPKLATKAKKYMEIGYQRELTYKLKDGSFSAFGERDEKGSTWLTAYVIRSFSDAMDYTFVDPEILGQSISWINRRQKDSGEYEERGRVLNKEMQGGGRYPGVPMTAFVLTALLRAGHKNEKALKYLEDNIEEYKSRPYVIAVTAYALGLANSKKLSRALDILTESAINEKGERHWAVFSTGETDKKEWWQDAPKPAEVETTSYALLSYLLLDRLSDALPCMRWLSSRRNSLGGFSSTQDTVVGIGALSEYAKKVSKGVDINIDVTQEGKTTNFKIDDENKVVLQRKKLGDLKQPVKVVANGTGMALAQVSWHYNVHRLSDTKPFECNKIVTEGARGKDVTVKLCCKYNLEGNSSMVVMEVEAPSGLKVDGELLENLNGKVNKLKRSETSKGDTLVSLYLDDVKVEAISLCLWF